MDVSTFEYLCVGIEGGCAFEERARLGFHVLGSAQHVHNFR